MMQKALLRTTRQPPLLRIMKWLQLQRTTEQPSFPMAVRPMVQPPHLAKLLNLAPPEQSIGAPLPRS